MEENLRETNHLPHALGGKMRLLIVETSETRLGTLVFQSLVNAVSCHMCSHFLHIHRWSLFFPFSPNTLPTTRVGMCLCPQALHSTLSLSRKLPITRPSSL